MNSIRRHDPGIIEEEKHVDPMMQYFGGYLSNQPYFGYYSNGAQMMPMDMHQYYNELSKCNIDSQMLQTVSTQQQQQQQQIGPGEPLYFGEPHQHPKQKRYARHRRRMQNDEKGCESGEESDTSCSLSEKDSYGPPGANLFIFHIPSDLTNYGLYNLFSHAGKILSVRIMINYSTGLSRGYGFVSFSTPEEASRAIRTMHGYSIGRKRLKVQLKQEDLRRVEALRKDQYPYEGKEEEEDDNTLLPSGTTSSATSVVGSVAGEAEA